MSLEQTIDNLQIRNANMVTFVGTSNTMIDTTTGRIQTKGFQHNSNVITDISGPHGRGVATLKKYPEIAFEEGKFDSNPTTNTFVQAGYTVTASSQMTGSTHDPWHAFDNTLSGNEGWITDSPRYNSSSPGEAQSGLGATQFPAASGRYGEYIDLQLPSKIRVKHFIIKTRAAVASWEPEASPGAGYLYGSINGTDWTEIKAFSGLTYGGMGTDGGTQETVQVDSTTTYNYLRFQVTHRAGQNGSDQYAAVGELEFYGYEEDPPAGDHSVDTTFKSRFNNPQLTGVQVLVDGATGLGTNQISGGPDPSGNQSTYVTDGKYWTLNGTLTSNLAVEANTFLEGDQPHSVSVWFNSSNLEANVSNTCVFSIASEEKLDSVNLDLQSNTWHNLTYAYQGEGGSRVTYLDGRKVAEDQAEDTFGEYPPFAMTGYSQGGYVASASNEEDSTRTAYTLFNDVESEGNGWRDTGGTFQAGTGGHYRSNGTYDPATGIPRANLGSDSGGTAFATDDEGEWVKLELPYKIKLNYFTLQPRNSTSIANGSNPSLSWGRSEFIKNGKIWGSNDGINWSVVHTISGTSASSDTAINSYTVGSPVAYKYFAIVITATNTSTDYASSTSLSEWKLYGHRENDLVRFPDPTNVLKYPHIILYDNGSNASEYAKRGYVVKASSHHAEYPPYHAFDGVYEWVVNQSAWISNGGYSSGVPTMTTTDPKCTTIDGVQTPGEWIELQTPHKIKVSYIKVTPQGENTGTLDRAPKAATLAGSIDGTTWETLLTWANVSDWAIASGTTGLSKTFNVTSNTNKSYNYFRLVSTETDNADQYTSIQEFEFYGTGVDSIPIQIGGGNIDKVANFRVYDKFIGEDQALEIWDAQKDEFGRAKSSMTLQKGRLGIGTTEPEGRLAVLDEPHGLEEFPPRAMTADKTYIEGHGEFCVDFSSQLLPSTGGSSGYYYAYNVFNGKIDAVNGGAWISMNGGNSTPLLYTSGSGLPTADAADTVVDGVTISGEYVQLKLPYKIKLSYLRLMPPNENGTTLDRAPVDGVLVGSTDGITWKTVSSWSGASYTNLQYNTFTANVDSTNYYNYLRVIVKKTGGATLTSIQELRYFGTREQGQSVLHDGQLTLTKSLTVPRIGPALDADDTPRRDRLVVEYNTSTNPTFEGAVRDTSGRGNDGILLDGAYYDTVEKALDISAYDATRPAGSQTAHIKSGILPGFTGNQAHTMSFWFKGGSDMDGTFATLAPQSGENSYRVSSIKYEPTNNRFKLEGWNNDFYVNVTLYTNTLYHVALTYEGSTVTTTTKKLYINGVQQTNTTDDTQGSATNFTDTIVCLGERIGFSGDEVTGSISNFKLYDVALTAEEVKTLYDMGRNGSVANPQPLHIAAPLYAPGVPVQIVSKVYKKQVAYGSTNSDRNIKELDISIKPKFPNSRILLHWMINGELHQDNVIRVARDGSYIIHGYNETQGTNQWSGVAAGAYDLNEDSTPENYCIDTYDEPGGTNTYNYQIYIGSSSTGSFPVYINRTYASLGADYREAGICFMSATEIAQ